VHKTDSQARVIYGGQADPVRDFTQKALDACKCASDIDVYAYHTYPGYGRNLNPETMDYGAYQTESPRALREWVAHYPGMKADIPFFDDEFNSIPAWIGSDESVQAKYVPRGLVYNLVAGVKTFVWLLAPGTDGNEYDDFGILHGLTKHDSDFTPRPVFFALQNTNAVFSDTKFDPTIEVAVADLPALRRVSGYPFMAYGLRSRGGKAIIAYWLAAHRSTLTMKNSGITHPVMVDILSGQITPLQWKQGTADTLENLPVKDSVIAIADENYFDWLVLPEAPSSLDVEGVANGVKLTWEVHGGDPTAIAVERRSENGERWQRIATLGATAAEFTDVHAGEGSCYRVRAISHNGESAFSNTARVSRSPVPR
jgi:hypothetical protein